MKAHNEVSMRAIEIPALVCAVTAAFVVVPVACFLLPVAVAAVSVGAVAV